MVHFSQVYYSNISEVEFYFDSIFHDCQSDTNLSYYSSLISLFIQTCYERGV